MMKKIIILLICIIMVIPYAAYAENDPPASLEAPKSFNFLESSASSGLDFRFNNPKSIIQLIENDYYIRYEMDWKINDGAWKFNKSWETFSIQSLWEYYEEYPNACSEFVYDEDYGSSGFITHHNFDFEHFDLINNTFYFRIRYIYEYEGQDPATEEWGYKHVVSPYAETSIGKLGASSLPTSLEAPVDLSVELLKSPQTGQPYFHFGWKVPDSVLAANQLITVYSWADWKIGNDKWATEKGEEGFLIPGVRLAYEMDIDPVEKGGWAEINIEENTYYFRKYFEFEKPDGTKVRSPFSNVVEIGTPAFYQGASNWAKPELQEAYDAGLVPDILKGADMTKPITREEFAETAVLLYEKTTGKTDTPTSTNPFTDTTNKQVLKAYALGITKGTSETAFSPKVLISREQCATMLYRTIKAIAPDGNYSITGVKDFPDQNSISSWAAEGTKYMSKLGIIKGDSNGNFMPKATTIAQEAVGYGMATREAAILMSVRTYNKFK